MVDFLKIVISNEICNRSNALKNNLAQISQISKF
jgi:hypothetical protein